MKNALYLLVAFSVLCISHQTLAQTTRPTKPSVFYQNPVIAGDFADPSIIRVGNTYYAVGTSSEWGPAYPIYTSTDLVNWQYVGPVFKTLPAWTMGSFWAPELYYRNGQFYVYYTARRKSDKHSYIGVATTTDLRKGFTDHGLLIEWTSEAIDAFVIDDAGKLYITWKAYGLDKGKDIELLGAELSADGLAVMGKPFTLLKADRNNWESGGMEGQAIIRHGNYYYMTYSGNACCGANCNYQVGFARAQKLQGPWEKYDQNPVLISDSHWKCPGHGTLVTTPDNRYFYLHHAYNGDDFTFVGRQGVLSELVWNDKTQWPAFRYGNVTPGQAESPLGSTQQENANLSVNFSQPTKTIPWVWDVSQPVPSYSVRDGQLQLTSTSSSPTGSFLGLVVRKGTYTFSADIIPQANVWQNLCVYGDASNAMGFGVRQNVLEIWQVKEGVRTVLQTASIPANTPAVTLQLGSRDGRFYDFSWRTGNGPATSLTSSPIDGATLPRWDRAPRVGISIAGAPKQSGSIKSIQLRY